MKAPVIHIRQFSRYQHERSTVWQHSWYCPSMWFHSFFYSQILSASYFSWTPPPSPSATNPCLKQLKNNTEVEKLYFFFWYDSCSINRRKQLFLKLEDFFWREHVSKLTLPYGIKGSGMLTYHTLLYLLSLLCVSRVLVSQVIFWCFTYICFSCLFPGVDME